jgi:predicted kinase
MSDQSTSGPRSVKIGADERTGWSSDRPRGRDGQDRPARPVDISTRCRTIKPSDRMRYSPGSLVVVVSASAADRDRFVNRVFEEQGAVLGIDKLRSMVAGKVDESALDATAKQLLDATIAKRLEKGEAVVIPTTTLDPEEREPYLRLAHKLRRPRHMVLVETAKDRVDEGQLPVLNELRRRLDAGELGAEGFQTAMRLGGSAVTELKRIVFRPAPKDDD